MSGVVMRSVVAGVRRLWFPALWSFIGLVSALDSYLLVRFRELLPDLEENPVGQYLIGLQGGQVGVFLRTKLAGTVAVLSVLAALYVYRHRWAMPIVGSVAAFQMGLLLYMTFSVPRESGIFPLAFRDFVETCAARDRVEPHPGFFSREPEKGVGRPNGP